MTTINFGQPEKSTPVWVSLLKIAFRFAAWAIRWAWYFWELVLAGFGLLYFGVGVRSTWQQGQWWWSILFGVFFLSICVGVLPAFARGWDRANLGLHRRMFHRALLDSSANHGQYLRASQIKRFRPGPVADSYEFVLVAAPGYGDDSLESLYESVRSDLEAYSVATVSDMGTPGKVRGHILKFDPISEVIDDNPELYEPVARDPYWPVPVGTSYDGSPVSLQMHAPGMGGLHTSIAGRSGSGKNSLANAILAGCALAGHELWLGDPKATELNWLPNVAVHRRETDSVGIVDMLEDLRTEMRRRQSYLETMGSTTWSADDGPPITVVLDELTSITTGADGLDRKQVARAHDLLQSLLSRGRSAGIALLIMTQQLSTEALPSASRSQIARAVSASVSRSHDATMNVPGCDPDDPLFSPLSLKGTLTKEGRVTSAGLFVVGGAIADPDRFRAALFDKERAAQAIVYTYATRSGSDLINTLQTESPF